MLFESMGEGCCIVEVIFDDKKHPIDYCFLDINAAFEGQTGLKDAKGKSMRQLAPNHEQHWFDIYGEIALSGETRRFESEAAALNRWYDVCAFRIGSAELHHVGIVFNDITERKKASEALRQITNAIPQQVWSARPDGQIDYINAYCYDYFGDIKIENGIVDWISVVHPNDIANSMQIWQMSLASGDDYEAEQRVFHKDSNEYRWNLSRAKAVRDARGVIAKWYGTNTDIHDRKLAEQAIQDVREAAGAANMAKPPLDELSNAGTHNAQIFREKLVLAHETLIGSYKRAAGSILVLSERTGGLGSALSTLVTPTTLVAGAVVILAGAFIKSVSISEEWAESFGQIQAAMDATGNSFGAGKDQIASYIDNLRQLHGVNTDTATEMVEMFSASAISVRVPIRRSGKRRRVTRALPAVTCRRRRRNWSRRSTADMKASPGSTGSFRFSPSQAQAIHDFDASGQKAEAMGVAITALQAKFGPLVNDGLPPSSMGSLSQPAPAKKIPARGI